MTTNDAKSHLAQPPPPVDTPFQVGLLNAQVSANADSTTTLRLQRVIKAPPERIYRAFLDPDAFAAWFPPNGLVARTHLMEPRVGGRYRFSFYTPNKSWTQTSSGEYVELVPDRKIVLLSRFEGDDPSKGATLRLTVTLTPVEEGTLVEVLHEGIPAPRGNSAPYGWAQSFEKLALLVEPELPF